MYRSLRIWLLPAWLCTCPGLSSPAAAGPALGIGIAVVPGTGWTVGVKVLSDDVEHSSYVSAGIDYVLSDSSDTRWRPNVGVGYQSESVFDEINVGYLGKRFDVGLSTGRVDNKPAPSRKPGVFECEPNCIDWPQ